MRQQFSGNSLSVIFDADDCSITFGPYAQLDLAIRTSVLTCVGEQVGYHLRDAIRIAVDPGIFDRELDAAICIFLAQTKCSNAMAGAFAKIHRLAIERDPAHCETFDIKKVVD